MTHLPVDAVLPELVTALRVNPAAVLLAPPGAGKTTRVPLALLEAPWLSGGIVMLEPRRLAAANAARWMASCLGEEVGQTVGYSIRFERKVSARTRIEVVTEGILTRRLQDDPLLEGTGIVIFDEFHERNLNSDLALALCRDVQLGLRDDLKIVVMSATLDGAPVARLLGDAPVIASEGRRYPVTVNYLPREPEGDPAAVAARAVLQALRETTGDILVFLPGAGEIIRCRKMLEEAADSPEGLLLTPLYGDLPFADQERAICPADRRKVVLSTNIAETSLTIEGIRTVIDSGLSRQLRFDPASGLNRLVTGRISAASAEQRAGRAGRLGPGTVYRLWTEHGQQTLIPHTPPEICTSDLTPLVLDLAHWGVADAGSLGWLDPPPAAAFAEGQRLLGSLGALDSQGRITATGNKMAVLPLHPRLSHLLLAADGRGDGAIACDLAALLSERDIFRFSVSGGGGNVCESDPGERLDLLSEWRQSNHGRLEGVDAVACRAVDRVARNLRRLLRLSDGTVAPVASERVGLMLAWAYPDRIARQREPGSDRYLLANGRGGRLSPRTHVRNQPFIVAVQVEGGERGDGMIHQASSISLEAIRREFADQIEIHRIVEWDGGRVVSREEERLAALVLGSRHVNPTADEAVVALIEGIRRGRGLELLNWSTSARQFRARVMFLARCMPEGDWPDFSGDYLLQTLEDWLGPYLEGVRSLAALAVLDILPALRSLLSWEQVRLLESEAPTHLEVPSGSRIALDYDVEDPPVLAVKLQEMFGVADTPRVASGRIPVVVHLLSPARRPVQVTRDLRGFWDGAYREVKKELKGRYPRHPWPDDPWLAPPTRHVKKRGS